MLTFRRLFVAGLALLGAGLWCVSAPAQFGVVGPLIGSCAPSQTALIHANGTNASQSFPNYGAGGTITAAGNAQVSTAQSKFGNGSAIFDNGADDALRGDGSSFYAFGTGALTVDLWIRPTATSAAVVFDWRPAATQGAYPTVSVAVTTLRLSYVTANTTRITGSTNISVNTWNHVALTRSGTSTRLFLNGTQEGSTYTDTETLLVGASRPSFGLNGFSASIPYVGYQDEIRVLKGTAAWTANFTPPTGPYCP